MVLFTLTKPSFNLFNPIQVNPNFPCTRGSHNSSPTGRKRSAMAHHLLDLRRPGSEHDGQPYGRILDFPNNQAMLLRSSPVLCVFDCACTVIDVIWWWVKKRGRWTVRQAARRALRRRFREENTNESMFQAPANRFTAEEMGTEDSVDDMEDGRGLLSRQASGLTTNSTISARMFSALRIHPWIRLFFFIFGVLPQIVKLYGLSGVPWSKVLGVMYMTPLLLLELVIVVAKQAEPTPSRSQSTHLLSITERALPLHLSMTISNLATTLQACMWIWAFGSAVKLGPIILPHTWVLLLDILGLVWFYMGLPMLVYLGALFLGLFLVHIVWWKWLSCLNHYKWLRDWSYRLSMVGMYLILMYLFVSYGVVINDIYPKCNDYIRATTLLALWMVFLWGLIPLSVFLLEKYITLSSVLLLESIPVFGTSVFVTNLVVALIYYTNSWDPTGTFRPSWTEYLG